MTDRDVPEPFAAATLQRRAPFGDNPDVGTRGTRTQQRILRAGLEVFDEVGYHECSVDRITAKAACSRPTFYQYFSSKEDLLRHLSADLAGRLFELAGGPDRITPDPAGWKVLRTYLESFGDVYDAYSPVFAVFSTSVAGDDTVARGAARVFRLQAEELRARVDRRAFRHRRGPEVVLLLLNGVVRAQRFREVLDAAGAGFDRARVDDALADVVHRTFFGHRPGVNVRSSVPVAGTPSSPRSPFASAWPPAEEAAPLGEAGRLTRGRLLDAGREVFASRGYHDTRVDDIVALADTSHASFYRYFENKQALFRILAAGSGRRVVATVAELPAAAAAPEGDGATRLLRQWLRRYLRTYRTEGPIIRAWVEAGWDDPELRAASPFEVEGLRSRLARFLAPRGFGDVDADALVLMALLDRSEPLVEASLLDEEALVDAFMLVLRRGVLPPRGAGHPGAAWTRMGS